MVKAMGVTSAMVSGVEADDAYRYRREAEKVGASGINRAPAIKIWHSW